MTAAARYEALPEPAMTHRTQVFRHSGYLGTMSHSCLPSLWAWCCRDCRAWSRGYRCATKQSAERAADRHVKASNLRPDRAVERGTK